VWRLERVGMTTDMKGLSSAHSWPGPDPEPGSSGADNPWVRLGAAMVLAMSGAVQRLETRQRQFLEANSGGLANLWRRARDSPLR